jgi:hypothetical protein
MPPKRDKPKPAAAKKGGRGGRRPGAGRPKGAKDRVRRVEDYRDLGDAPADELERLRWMSEALGVRARQVMLDTRMSDERRGGELRSLARAMNALVTRSRLRAAELAVRGEVAEMARPVADPPVGPRPGGDDPEPDGS